MTEIKKREGGKESFSKFKEERPERKDINMHRKRKREWQREAEK